jgi:hypothetical protein
MTENKTLTDIENRIKVLDYSVKDIEICSRCGFIQEAHINRGLSYPCHKDKDGKYHFKPCKKFQFKKELLGKQQNKENEELKEESE